MNTSIPLHIIYNQLLERAGTLPYAIRILEENGYLTKPTQLANLTFEKLTTLHIKGVDTEPILKVAQYIVLADTSLLMDQNPLRQLTHLGLVNWLNGIGFLWFDPACWFMWDFSEVPTNTLIFIRMYIGQLAFLPIICEYLSANRPARDQQVIRAFIQADKELAEVMSPTNPDSFKKDFAIGRNWRQGKKPHFINKGYLTRPRDPSLDASAKAGGTTRIAGNVLRSNIVKKGNGGGKLDVGGNFVDSNYIQGDNNTVDNEEF